MTARTSFFGTAREWAVNLGVATVAGAFVGVIGPFGSYYNGPPGPRVFHFVVCFWVGTLIFGMSLRLAEAWSRRGRVPPWLGLAILAPIACGLLALFVSWLATLLWPSLRAYTPWDWYSQCLVLSVPVLAFMLLGRGLRAARPFAPVALQSRPSPDVPVGEVLCLRMEDHYVRVHTLAGSRLVAGPFERVIAGLGGQEGLRVHRSWWVARDAVMGVVAEGRNLRLVLRGDLSAPVSRASVARLRQAGWLASEKQ
ncbi:LytTR family DNA-binding domain-containing protein [soil metagenome]